MPRIKIEKTGPTPATYTYGQMIATPGVYRQKGSTDNTRFITVEKAIDGLCETFYTDPDEEVFEIMQLNTWHEDKFEKLDEIVTVHFS